jgi:hypothetical protein
MFRIRGAGIVIPAPSAGIDIIQLLMKINSAFTRFRGQDTRVMMTPDTLQGLEVGVEKSIHTLPTTIMTRGDIIARLAINTSIEPRHIPTSRMIRNHREVITTRNRDTAATTPIPRAMGSITDIGPTRMSRLLFLIAVHRRPLPPPSTLVNKTIMIAINTSCRIWELCLSPPETTVMVRATHLGAELTRCNTSIKAAVPQDKRSIAPLQMDCPNIRIKRSRIRGGTSQSFHLFSSAVS